MHVCVDLCMHACMCVCVDCGHVHASQAGPSPRLALCVCVCACVFLTALDPHLILNRESQPLNLNLSPNPESNGILEMLMLALMRVGGVSGGVAHTKIHVLNAKSLL